MFPTARLTWPMGAADAGGFKDRYNRQTCGSKISNHEIDADTDDASSPAFGQRNGKALRMLPVQPTQHCHGKLNAFAYRSEIFNDRMCSFSIVFPFFNQRKWEKCRTTATATTMYDRVQHSPCWILV